METGSEGESDRNTYNQSDGSNKRKRQMKTPFQLGMLERAYALEMHPSKATSAKLSETLGLTDRQLQMWFSSRRLKDKNEGTVRRAAGGGGVRDQAVSLNTIKKLGALKFEVGQLAESKTFEQGFRSAWFKCKIKDIILNKNKILPEYYDFADEKIIWAKIYQKPSYRRKPKNIKEQLMVRPQYPVIYHKNEMPAVNSIIEECVVIEGEWKVGDLVDWETDDCFWCGSIIKILSDGKVKIELPKPPVGQGKIYEAFCKDLRPSLDWSPTKGWTLLTKRGRTSCNARIILPSSQDENASSPSRKSEISNAVPMEDSPNSEQVKVDDDVEKASSSDSISTTHVEENKTDDDDNTWENVDHNNMIDLNIMHEETLESSILDLEELANRIKWLRRIVETNQSRSGSWKFAQHSST